ncbi:MAG: Ig-like domain-containing protein, partial [Candidatus Muiribacteriota bacterium]
MEKKYLLILVLFGFLSLQIYSFTEVKGFIVNKEEKPVYEYIEVSLNDNKIITGDSEFNFPSVEPGDYILKVNAPDSRNHNSDFSSYENDFTIANENGKASFYNFNPKIVLTEGLTWNFKGIIKNKEGEVLNDIKYKLYSVKNGKYIENQDDIKTGPYRLVVNEPFFEAHDSDYDFTEIDNRRSMLEITVGTFNENITLYEFLVWQNHDIRYTSKMKNLGRTIELNYPGSPLVFHLGYEKIPPWVVKSWPVNNQTMVSVRDNLSITFSEKILFDSTVRNKILLYNAEKREYVDVSITYDVDQKTIIATPRENLDRGTKYQLIISNIYDLNNNMMESDFQVTFYTETTDFEDFHHKYMSRIIQGIPLDEYEPAVKGDREQVVSRDVRDAKQSDDEITVRRPELDINVPVEDRFYSKDFTSDYRVSGIDDYTLDFYLDSKEIPLNFQISSEGRQKFAAKLYDKEGKLLESEFIYFTLDKTPPQIEINPSLDDINYLTSYEGVVNVNDENLDIVEIELNGRELRREINLTEEGHYILDIHAEDKANNEASKSYEIIIDNTSPEIVTNIEDDNLFRLPVRLEVDIIDENLDYKSVSLNDEELETTEFEINEEGRYKIHVEAEDKAGNKTSFSKNFEAYTDTNYEELLIIFSYKEKFSQLWSYIEEVDEEEGILTKQSIIESLITKKTYETGTFEEYDKAVKIYEEISFDELVPMEEAQIKQILMLEKYWGYPLVTEYIASNRNQIETQLEDYNYLRNKFNEFFNIINIARGNIIQIYESDNDINIDYFNMFYDEYVEFHEELLEIGELAPEIKITSENYLNNLNFGRKLLHHSTHVTDKALEDNDLRQMMMKELTTVITSMRQNDFAEIIDKIKNPDFVSYLKTFGRELQKHHSFQITSQKFYPVSTVYFAINIDFLIEDNPFSIEFWYEYSEHSDELQNDYITNIFLIEDKIKDIVPAPVQVVEEEKGTSWGVIFTIILLILLMLLAVLFMIMRKRKKMKMIKEVYDDDQVDKSEEFVEEEKEEVKKTEKPSEIEEKDDESDLKEKEEVKKTEKPSEIEEKDDESDLKEKEEVKKT